MLSTAHKKIDSIYQGSANKLLKDVNDNSLPINTEDFDITCNLLAVSFFNTDLLEEDIEKMNSESAPLELKDDVFKPFRDKVDLSDSGQAERFGRMRNKVIENLKSSVRSRTRRLSRGSVSSASKRGNTGEVRSGEKPAKLKDNRPSPKKDTVPKSSLPQFKKS